MTLKNPVVFIMLFGLLVVSSCDTDDFASNRNNLGYTPVYMDSVTYITQFNITRARTDFDSTILIKHPTHKGHYLYIVKYSGINVIDEVSKKSVGYINVPQIQYFSLKGDTLTCHLPLSDAFYDLGDLPQIEFTGLKFHDEIDGWANLNNIKVQEEQSTKRFATDKVFFECPNKEKGFIIKWNRLGGNNLKCYKQF